MNTQWSSIKSLVVPEILDTIRDELKFKEMTPVQAACIPQMLNYKDVVAEAVTGSGKTVAFLVPVLQIMMKRDVEWKKHHIGAIVIAPTRELANQISTVLTTFLQKIPKISHLLFIGGTSVDEDLEKFRTKGGNILIVTPGRFCDILVRQEGTLLRSGLKHLEVLILDEADCLLSMGFDKALNSILQMLPKQRRTGLFSATQTTEVTKLVKAGLRNPVSVVVVDRSQKGKSPGTLDNNYAIVEPQFKLHALINFIRKQKKKKILIFFATCACVDYFSFVLKRLVKDISVSSMHGKMKEKVRISIFEKFRQTEEGVLCCTDVMARGIDITKKIHWVVQFDPPSNPALFIHRSGRTARNGEEGFALLMLQPNEEQFVKFLEISQKVKMNEMDITDCINPTKFEEEKKSIQKLQLQDKAVYDKGMRAFVSYYKAYSRYDCKLILRIKDLDLGGIATCYALLKFPKMSELKANKPSNFEEVDVDMNLTEYKDKIKEESRKRKFQVYQETGAWPENSSKKTRKIPFKNGGESSWSIAKEKRAKKQIKKGKREARHLGEGSKGGLFSQVEFQAMEQALVEQQKGKCSLDS